MQARCPAGSRAIPDGRYEPNGTHISHIHGGEHLHNLRHPTGQSPNGHDGAPTFAPPDCQVGSLAPALNRPVTFVVIPPGRPFVHILVEKVADDPDFEEFMVGSASQPSFMPDHAG